MKFSLPAFLKKGGSVVKNDLKDKPTGKSGVNPTIFWVGATVAFAALFFLSSVFDMRVKVTFGSQSATTTTNGSLTPTTQSAPAGGIASQVGGC
jgi:hypothetical protein